MARGKKASPEVIYKVMASYAVTGSYSETAKAMGMAVSSVKNIIESHKNEPDFVKLGEEKRKEFSKVAGDIIDIALQRLKRDIEDKDKDIPINHLTTVIGTLYDKKALCDGKETDRVAIEVKLPEGCDEYAG